MDLCKKNNQSFDLFDFFLNPGDEQALLAPR